jgi:hypothetical protein
MGYFRGELGRGPVQGPKMQQQDGSGWGNLSNLNPDITRLVTKGKLSRAQADSLIANKAKIQASEEHGAGTKSFSDPIDPSDPIARLQVEIETADVLHRFGAGDDKAVQISAYREEPDYGDVASKLKDWQEHHQGEETPDIVNGLTVEERQRILARDDLRLEADKRELARRQRGEN